MSKQPATPAEMADRLASHFPIALTPPVLDEYRLAHVASRGPLLTRELLSLTLFWITSALEAHYPGIGDVLVLPEVRRVLARHWTSVYELAEADWPRFLDELPERFRDYERVKAEGGSAVSVSSQACFHLESNWVVRSDDQPQVLALILDLVPVEAIGEVFEEIELVAPP